MFFSDALESPIDRTLTSGKRDLTWVDFIIQNKNNLGLCQMGSDNRFSTVISSESVKFLFIICGRTPVAR